MPRDLILAAAASLFLGVAGPAHADAQASATLGDIRLQLVDLDPADGIAPSLTFLDSSNAVALAAAYALAYPPRADESRQASAGPFGSVSAGATATGSGATTTVTGDFTVGATMRASASSSLAALGKGVSMASIGDQTGSQALQPRFMLSPETALYVSGIGEVDAAASDQDDAFAIVLLALNSGGAGAPSGGSIEVDAGKLDQPPFVGHYEAFLAAHYINDSTVAVLGDLSLVASARADSQLDAPPSPAPEPGEAELAALGGLLVLAASGQRRRVLGANGRW
jgi:hypothetical protein